MTKLTAARKNEIKTALANALQSEKMHSCYGGCARIYLKAGMACTVDELFQLTKRQQTSKEKAHKKEVDYVFTELGGRVVGKRFYIGYDNNTKIEYSKAVNICNNLKAIGISVNVEGDED